MIPNISELFLWANVDSKFQFKNNLKLNQSQLSLTWAWHSSAPACLFYFAHCPPLIICGKITYNVIRIIFMSSVTPHSQFLDVYHQTKSVRTLLVRNEALPPSSLFAYILKFGLIITQVMSYISDQRWLQQNISFALVSIRC